VTFQATVKSSPRAPKGTSGCWSFATLRGGNTRGLSGATDRGTLSAFLVRGDLSAYHNQKVEDEESEFRALVGGAEQTKHFHSFPMRGRADALRAFGNKEFERVDVDLETTLPLPAPGASTARRVEVRGRYKGFWVFNVRAI
jgi:hypothetical protein